MKTHVISFRATVVLAVVLIAFAFKPVDDCKMYMPMKEGAKFEITHYDRKDKKESRAEYEISSVSDNTATISMKAYDKKEELIFDSEYNVECEDGKFKVDIRGILNSAQLQQLESMNDMEVSVESEDLILPSNMSVGDQLPDGKLNMEVETGAAGMALNFSTTIKNRKVEAMETVTTDAGTFDCVVITADVVSKFGFGSFTYQSKDWYAENVGMVRSETYSRDKLQGYSLLTKLEK